MVAGSRGRNLKCQYHCVVGVGAVAVSASKIYAGNGEDGDRERYNQLHLRV